MNGKKILFGAACDGLLLLLMRGAYLVPSQMWQTSPSGVVPLIKFVDMFSGIGGFREGLTRAGGFECVGHSEIDKYANRSYNALFDTKGEWFVEDARKADPETMPEFRLLCGGFPCQTYPE